MISSQPFNLTTNLTFFNLQPTVSGDCDFGHGGVLPGSPQGDTWWVSGLVAGDVGGSAVAHARVLWSSVWRHPAELWFNNKIKIDVFIWNPSFVLDWSPCYIFKMLESLKTYIQKYWKMVCVCVWECNQVLTSPPSHVGKADIACDRQEQAGGPQIVSSDFRGWCQDSWAASGHTFEMRVHYILCFDLFDFNLLPRKNNAWTRRLW